MGAAAQTCRPAKADQWRHIQQKRLRRGAFEKVIESLEDHLEPANTPEELSPVRNAHRYLSNRRECLDYPRALELDLPIGSGIIESGHRHGARILGIENPQAIGLRHRQSAVQGTICVAKLVKHRNAAETIR